MHEETSAIPYMASCSILNFQVPESQVRDDDVYFSTVILSACTVLIIQYV